MTGSGLDLLRLLGAKIGLSDAHIRGIMSSAGINL